MGNIPRLTGLMIGLVLVSCFAGIFALFMGEMNTGYSPNNTSNIDLTAYNKLDNLTKQANQIKGNTTAINQESGVLDLIGAFFYQGYQVLVSIPRSFDFFSSMTEKAFIDADLGIGGQLIKNTLLTIVTILIFLGVILSLILKRDIL